MTMYLEHFGLREAPFRITPHTEFFFSGANRGATLEALLYAITAGEGMVKVTGEVGSGKTMLCRVLMERLPETVETIFLAVPSLTRDEMLAAIASDLGIDTPGANLTKVMRALQDRLIELHAEGHQVVALIDEAHAMPLATLEEIRLLSNLETGTEKLLQIVLFGQPELDAHLALPHMRQLKERITHNFTLLPLPPQEISEYLRFRMRAAGYHGPDLFNAEALRIIADASEGLTRRINIFADKTLLAAFAAGTHTITADHARAAVTDTQIVLLRRDSPRRLAAAAALGLVAGVGLGFVLAQVAGVPSPSPAVAAMPARATPAPQALAIPVSTTTAAAPAAPLRSLASRLAAGNDMLGDATPRYAVQLMVTDARERMYIENYLAEAGRAVPYERLFVVASGSPESPRLGVLLGPFDARTDAGAALEALPPTLRVFRPFVRTMDSVREDARRAERS
jgi:MSHA biogenesis protein MshM